MIYFLVIIEKILIIKSNFLYFKGIELELNWCSILKMCL